jgi:methionine-R-sulfoxide reductase
LVRILGGSGKLVAGLALVGVLGFGIQVSAQDQGGSWSEMLDEVSRLTQGITVDGKPYVVHGETYDPDRRIVHEEGADIDYPIEMSETQWRERLGGERYYVLREDGTEESFDNPLYDNKREGIYYSAATGQPLFHSDDKYESGTGWPSFTKPIAPDAVAYMWDEGFFSRRIEVIDSLSGSHLGHVFPDGPAPTGQRYCMNSAALIFVPEGGDPPKLLEP